MTEASYRELALKILPWICVRCAREFPGSRLRELTVHHKDGDHHHNPPDGSNWELLCIYCHENEHARFEDARAGGGGTEAGAAPATHQPLAALGELLKRKGKTPERTPMSLSQPTPRRHLHTRTITCEGFERDDGLFDIEARIVDVKTYAVTEPYRGLRQAGEHVHDMQLRLTLDRAMVVRDVEVSTNHAPYDPCYTVAAAYKGLVGAKIGGGWRRAVSEAVGGVKGCTHLRELLMPAATVAFQTMGSWPKAGKVATEVAPDKERKKPYFIDACRAWASDGPVTERLFPLHYRKPD